VVGVVVVVGVAVGVAVAVVVAVITFGDKQPQIHTYCSITRACKFMGSINYAVIAAQLNTGRHEWS
jgi:hypothetical protein